MHNVDIDLQLEHVTKVEGAADVTVTVRNGKVESAKYAITEYKRFYTKAIEGKPVMALPQLLSRICGTCSNAHIMASLKACEASQGIVPTRQTKILRKLTMHGLNIRDHALHLYLFAYPDYVGKDNFLSLDENDPVQHQVLHDAFDIKAAGNYLAELVAGRSIHATYPTLGGFLKFPSAEGVAEAIKKLESIRPAVIRTIERFAACPFKFDRKTDFLALVPKEGFDYLEGEIRCSDGCDPIPAEKFRDLLEHVAQPHSTASAYKHHDKCYMVGSLARINLIKDQLHPKTKADAAKALARFPSTDIFDNNLAQAIEILQGVDESLDILRAEKFAPEPMVKMPPRAGVGVGVIEAPRGALYHQVETDAKGNVVKGAVIVPTNQNQLNMEADIARLVQDNLEKMDKDQLVHEIEKLVRAYDPCMSCAAHFLKLKIVNE